MSCDRDFCPWVKDANDPNRYFCLRCSKERKIDAIELPWFAIIILAVIAAAIIDSGNRETAPAIAPTQTYYEQGSD